MTIVSTLYLATDSTINPPINKSNLSNVIWYIDWDTIFHGKTGTCKITANMISKVGATPDTWNSTVGSMNASFSSNYALLSNAFPITALNRNQYIEVGVSTTTYVYYFQANNLQNSSAPTINIPSGKIPFNIMMLDTFGNYITNFPEYQVYLYFDWEN
jgi:hypothetical protein